MYQRVISFVLGLLKVPHDPQPPPGDPASLQVFRAGRNHLRLKLFGWGFAQVLAFAGIVFWVVMFVAVEEGVALRRNGQPAPTVTADSFAKTMEKAGQEVAGPRDKVTGKRKGNGFAGFKRGLVEIASQAPNWVFPLLWVLKGVGLLLYVVQLPVTYVVARMDYELRWYMVTDRSLRLRHGVWKVAESTMSFANIQQVVVSQGPLQRLLGLADVKVQSAGGGSGGSDSHGNPHGGEDLHLGLFHSVTNAPEIRDLILERLRRFRESGLGDPDEKSSALSSKPALAAATAPADLLAAAHELTAEARALRVALN